MSNHITTVFESNETTQLVCYAAVNVLLAPTGIKAMKKKSVGDYYRHLSSVQQHLSAEDQRSFSHAI